MVVIVQNAFSLNVLEPGEIAATAGTSAVIYCISDKKIYDQNNRINKGWKIFIRPRFCAVKFWSFLYKNSLFLD